MNFLHSAVNHSRSLASAFACVLILVGFALSARAAAAQALPTTATTAYGALQTVRGAAALLSVGRDGSVWAVDPDGALYVRAQNSSTWSRRGDGVAAVAAVDQNTAWILSASGELVAISAGNRRVYAAPDAADLAVGIDGSLVLATDTGALMVSRDGQWVNGQFPHGLARRVALDEHALPWVINEAAALYRFDGTQWQAVATNVRHVSIGSSGAAMLTDMSGRTLYWDANAQRWTVLPALSALALLATRIAPDGTLWSVMANGEIATLPVDTSMANASGASSATTANPRPPAAFTRLLQWKTMRGRGRSLSVSPSGLVIALDAEGTAHRYQGRGQWSIFPGRFIAVVGAADQSLWALKEGGLLMRSVRGIWSDIPAAPLASIAPDAKGAGLWALTPDGSVMRLSAPEFSPQKIVAPRARQLSVDEANAVWLLDMSGDLWRSNSISGSAADWVRVSFGGIKAKSIAGGARQSAYAVSANDEIYWFDPRENLFKPANGRATAVALGPRDALWAMTASGDILASAAALAADNASAEPVTTPDLSRPATVSFALRAETTRKPLQFRAIEGLAGDITVSVFGAVFATGKESGVTCFSSNLQKFLPLISGTARRVSASPDRDVWIVDALGRLTWLKNAVAASAISPLASAVEDVSVAADGTVFIVGRDEQVLRRSLPNDAFEPVELRANGFTLNAYRVAAVSRNLLWIANKSGGLWRCNNGQCVAQTVSARDISVGPEGSVFVVDAAGNLQRQVGVAATFATSATTAVASFERVGQGSVANVATGPQGLPWLVTATGTVLTAEPLPKPSNNNRGGNDFCQTLASASATATGSSLAVPALPVSLPIISIIARPDAVTLGRGGALDLLANDSLGAARADAGASGNVRFQLLATDLPVSSVASDGRVTISATQNSGSYSLRYSICAAPQGQPCATSNAVIRVTPPVFLAALIDDAVTLARGGSFNVLANDTIDGRPVNLGVNAVFSVISSTLPAAAVRDGVVTIAADQAIGTYAIRYQLCGLIVGQSCATANASITVSPPAFVATVVDDRASLLRGASFDLLANDRVAGATVIVGGNARFVLVSSALPSASISAGVVTIASDQAIGAYPLRYQLCGLLAGQSCVEASAVITVIVPPFIAVVIADDFTLPPGASRDLLANDSVGGNPVLLGANASFSVIATTLPPSSISASGVLTVPATQAPGSYSINYQLCGLQAGQSCVATLSTIIVTAVTPPFSASVNPENVTLQPGQSADLLANDAVNGRPVDIGGNARFSVLATTLPGGSISVSGVVSIPATLPAGVYSINYRLCGLLAGQGCFATTSIITVVIPAPAFVAVVNGEVAILRPFETLDLLANDTVSGGPVNVGGNASFSVLSSGAIPASAISATGVLTIPAAQPVSQGINITYQLCGLIAGQSCLQASALIAVLAPWSGTPIADFVVGLAPGTTLNLLANDTTNGVAAVAGVNVVFERRPFVGQFPPLPANAVSATGVVTMPQTAVGGQFGMAYRICGRFAGQGCSADVDVAVIAP